MSIHLFNRKNNFCILFYLTYSMYGVYWISRYFWESSYTVPDEQGLRFSLYIINQEKLFLIFCIGLIFHVLVQSPSMSNDAKSVLSLVYDSTLQANITNYNNIHYNFIDKFALVRKTIHFWSIKVKIKSYFI